MIQWCKDAWLKHKLKKHARLHLEIPIISFKGICTVAFVSRVLDGDTVEILIHVHQRTVKIKLRLLKIDTPELRSKDKNEVRLAIRAKEAMSLLVENKMVFVVLGKFDTYGRVLGYVYSKRSLYVEDQPMQDSINEMMIKNGMAKQFM